MAKKQSMTERVLNELRNDIINWNYNENDMITEAEISQKFGVSKTPSREALNYLCMEGFLEKIPNKGYLVKGISVMELQSLFQYRGILEKACAEMAIQYATADELRFLQELTEEHVKKAEGSTYQEYSEMNMDFHMSVAYLSATGIWCLHWRMCSTTSEGSLSENGRALAPRRFWRHTWSWWRC